MYDNPNKKPRKVKPIGADGHRGRMFTKFLNTSDCDMLPRDIVEMLLYFSIPVRDTRDSAVDLMSRSDNNIRKLLSESPEYLQRTDGVGPSSALLLNLVGHIADRLESDSSDERKSYHTREEICQLFSENYNFPKEDELWVAFFDNAMRAIIHKFKSEPIELYAEDIYNLVGLSAKYHSNILAIGRMAASRTLYPTNRDMMICRYVKSSLSASQITLFDYFISTADDTIAISKPY